MNNTITQLKSNNQKAQCDFYKKHSSLLFRVAYRYVNNESDAGGIVNTGFYKIFTSINKFNYTNEEMLLAWMKKIIVNESLTLLRKKHEYTNIDELSVELPQSDCHADSNLAAEDYYKMIRALPQDSRTVFNLYAIDGFSHKEIALRLGIKESSSRVYLARARKALQESLLKKSYCYEK